MQMAVPVVANEFVGHGNQEESRPRPSKSERVGHPEEQSPKKQSQYRRVDLLKWYAPTVRAVDRKMRERVGHPDAQDALRLCGRRSNLCRAARIVGQFD
jgi:hypothetical protein